MPPPLKDLSVEVQKLLRRIFSPPSLSPVSAMAGDAGLLQHLYAARIANDQVERMVQNLP